MLVLQVARLGWVSWYLKKKKRRIAKWWRVERSVALKQCYSSSMLENQRLFHVLLFGDGVLLVVAVWLSSLLSLSRFLASFCMSHAIQTRFSTTLKMTNTLQSPQWLIIGVIEKQKVQSYDLRIVAWYNGCQLKNTQMTRQTQQEYAHTTHNPYYGCAVKSNHQNFLLIEWLVLTLYVCLILSDKPTLFSFLIWPSGDAASLSCLLQISPLFCFLLHLIFKLSCCSHISNTALFSFCQLLLPLIYSCHWFTLAARMKAMRTSWREPLFSSF
jgi:hypothetical protein